MKKVLLIAFYFNQTNEIASKRLRGLAKYLPQFGWETIVVVPRLDDTSSKNAKYDLKVIETDYVDMLDKWLNKFKISSKKTSNNSNIITEPNNKFHPHKRDSNRIKESNNKFNSYKINLNDIGENKNLKKKTVANSEVFNKLLPKVISLAGELFAYPDGMKYWYTPAIEASCEIIEKNKDIKGIISSSWPVTSHIIAKDLKKQFNIPWIADLRDLWNMNPYISHNFIRSYFEKRLELKTFESVDILTTTTELAALNLKKLHPNAKIYPIVSGFDPEDFSDIENSYGFDKKNQNISYQNNKLNFTYAGSLYGGKRDPNLLFKGLSQLIDEGKIDSSKIALDFYGDSENLEKIATKYSIREILNIHGLISQKEVLAKQKESQVLLLISWNNKKEEMFIPGKIYEYFAVKRPILSIGYKDGSLKDLIKETNVGYHVSTLSQTKGTLIKLYNDFMLNKTLKYEGNDKVNSYSMINTAKKFGKILDSIDNS
ncbi:MAG: glycosyl transferase GT4 family protein [Methanobacteriaceae archaeon]|jgi:hypothetical protein|nr:glycosyl transferase GT4 family protein [Candidatus Methanorudis spinitermitis]